MADVLSDSLVSLHCEHVDIELGEFDLGDVDDLSVSLVFVGVEFDTLSVVDRPVVIVDVVAVSNFSSFSSPTIDASPLVNPSSIGVGVFESSVVDKIGAIIL